MYSALLVILLGIVIIIFLKDIIDLEISTIKRKFEVPLMMALVVATVIIIILFAIELIHYLIGVLGLIIIFLEFNRRGITSKGIVVAGELNIYGYWNKIESVKILRYNNKIKVIVMRSPPFREEIQFYDLAHYEILLNVLLNYLPEKNIKVKLMD